MAPPKRWIAPPGAWRVASHQILVDAHEPLGARLKRKRAHDVLTGSSRHIGVLFWIGKKTPNTGLDLARRSGGNQLSSPALADHFVGPSDAGSENGYAEVGSLQNHVRKTLRVRALHDEVRTSIQRRHVVDEPQELDAVLQAEPRHV